MRPEPSLQLSVLSMSSEKQMILGQQVSRSAGQQVSRSAGQQVSRSAMVSQVNPVNPVSLVSRSAGQQVSRSAGQQVSVLHPE